LTGANGQTVRVLLGGSAFWEVVTDGGYAKTNILDIKGFIPIAFNARQPYLSE
jgi:hypothetical protein